MAIRRVIGVAGVSMLCLGSRYLHSGGNRMRLGVVFLAVLSAGLIPPHSLAQADEVYLDGVWHRGVLITESPSQYYVHFPESGELRRVPKESLAAAAVRMTSMPEERDALRTQWAAARGAVNDVGEARRMRTAFSVGGVVPPGSSEAEEPPVTATRSLRLRGEAQPRRESDTAYASSGMVDSVRLRGVPLGDALDAIFRPLGLDYEVAPYGLYVSTPDRLRHEARERLETRIYHVAPSGETMPKVVVGQLPATTQTLGFGVSGGVGGFGVSGRSLGGGAGQGFGRGAGGRGIGYGGGGFGQGFGGNFGGGFAGAVSPVSQVGNVSELFRNIDDRVVGEAPAQIATAGVAR